MAEFDVTLNHCLGHFPGNPIFPGVHLTEAIAQAGGLLIYYLMGCPGFNEVKVILRSAGLINFRKPVLPPCCLRLEVRVTNEKRKPVYKITGGGFVNDELVVRVGEVTLIADQ